MRQSVSSARIMVTMTDQAKPELILRIGLTDKGDVAKIKTHRYVLMQVHSEAESATQNGPLRPGAIHNHHPPTKRIRRSQEVVQPGALPISAA